MRILFIGNSHTYLHYMPQLLTGLAWSRGRTVLTEQSVGEGASLAWHWKGSDGLSGIIEREGKRLAHLEEEQALLLQEAARDAVLEQLDSGEIVH